MNDRDIHIHMRISRRALVWGAAVLLLCCSANEVVSESMTMTTYYPAPTGTYRRLVTTGGTVANPSHTILARDAGNVGIGTTDPQAKLAVAGQLMITGGSPGAGKVLTSDAAGLASWQAGGTWPSGSYCIMANGVCPTGFSAGELHLLVGCAAHDQCDGVNACVGSSCCGDAWTPCVKRQILSFCCK